MGTSVDRDCNPPPQIGPSSARLRARRATRVWREAALHRARLNWKGSIRGEAVSAPKSNGVRFQGDVVKEGTAGSFIGFEDRDGNRLYLAELYWSGV